MNNITKKTFIITNGIYISCICILVALLFNTEKNNAIQGTINRDLSGNYVFTNPILDYEIDIQGVTAIPYEQVHKKVAVLKSTFNIEDASVYYRDLNNGQWIGINEKAFFSPASLMKVSLFIAFLKEIESNKELVHKKVTATDEYFKFATEQNFDITGGVIKGEVYELGDLAEIMVQKSDNVAALMLSKFISQNTFNSLFKSIGVTYDENIDPQIRIKDYSGFFRILYNASYLNREMSETALAILSISDFTEGLVAGVSKDIKITHKYGERIKKDKITGKSILKETQLHDCGIVYQKNNPYILCVMTRGSSLKDQESFIKEVSTYFFEQTK